MPLETRSNPQTQTRSESILPDSDDDEVVSYTASKAAGAFTALLRFAWPFLGKYRIGLACIGFGLVIETLYNVIMPLSLMYLIDVSLGEKNLFSLYVILGSLATAGIVASVTGIWYERWDARTSCNVIADLRSNLFDRIQVLSTGYHSRTNRGAILSRFSIDLAAVENATKHIANSAFLPLLELAAGIALMFWLNWQMAAVALLIFPIALVGPRLITPLAIKWSYRHKVNEAEILSIIQENVAAQAIVKAFGLERRSAAWLNSRNDEDRKTNSNATFASKMVERTVTIAVLFLHLVVLSIGSFLAINGKLSIGTFVTFEASFWEVSYNIARLMQFVPIAIQAAAATRHIQELMDETKSSVMHSAGLELDQINHGITFSDVSFHYEGDKHLVLRDLNFSIKSGETIAIVGASGSGKSTLINLILRLIAPTNGIISIDGRDINELDQASLRSSIGVVFQENMLFNMSVGENIRLGNLHATEEDVVAAAQMAEIDSHICGLPNGYDTLVGERGDTLSGGQRQRIAIARAIVRNPSVLILDEATSALDNSTEAAINLTLQKIAQGRTVIYSTHRLQTVTGADEILVMNDGILVESGSHTQLLTKSQTYSQLWAGQIHDQVGHGNRNSS